MSQWKGKLVIRWPGELSWSRWAYRNTFAIEAILEESKLARGMPDWKDVGFTWEELKVIPKSWHAALSRWRGIYFILDVSDGKGYVGSAYGHDNLLGRWLNYAQSGHGGNKRLRKRRARDLRFSILERASPDMSADEMVALENSWKTRLHTREHGLNEN